MKNKITNLLLTGLILLAGHSIVNAQTNLALSRPVVVSSTEQPLVGTQAVDGNASTRWASNASDPQWIYVDLGSSQPIDRVKIIWETASASNYVIQTSADATIWTDLKTVTGNSTLVNDHLGLTGSGRYVRMYGTARNTGFGYSIYEFEIYGATAPIAPTTLTATATSTTQINLNWTDASNNETGFQIERSLTTGTGFGLIATTAANATNFSNTGLTANTQYFYRVRAINGAGNSTYTAEATVRTSAPTAPRTLVATAASTTQINLTWVDASTNETGFQIERSLTSGSGFALITTTTANVTSFSNTGLTPGTQYFYRVRAINAVGNSAFTSTVNTTTAIPNAPTAPTATAASTTRINLTWIDASNNETGFQIERSLTSGTGFALVTTTAANVTSFGNTGLTANTQYFYRIRATNALGSSAFTSEVSARTSIPTAPTTLVATAASANQINLTWVDASNNETGFRIERSLSSSTGFALVTTTAANTTSFSNTGLTANTQYFYRVRATNAVGSSAFTPVVNAITVVAPEAPTALVASALSTSQINLTWVDNSTTETSFQIERSLTTGTGFALVTSTLPNTAAYSDVSLAPGTTYYYRIRATNTGGNSPYTSEAFAITLPPAPNPPTDLIVTALGSSVSLTWSDVSNNETGFEIERSLTAGSGFSLITTTSANITSYVDTDVIDATQYYYRIRSINSGGNSANSLEVSVTFFSLPDKPTGFSTFAISATSVDLIWTDASSNETAFQIERSLTPGSGFTLVATPFANAVSYTDNELTENTTYYYRIRAINTNGDSGFTQEISLTTKSPAPPIGLTAVASSSTSINLNWTDASGSETGFQIERSFTTESGFSLISTSVANAASYLDEGLTPNTSYFYRIRAVNGTGNSTYTTHANATTPQSTPAAPSNFSVVSASSSSSNLSWTDNSTTELEFEIERSISSESGFALITTVLANTTMYTDVNLASGTTYYYRVRAANGGGYSDYTPVANIRLPLEGANPACENIFCDNNGGVGIGTSKVPSGYRLSVNGKIMAEGVKVLLQGQWPDYVFDKGYVLRDIPSLKEFIVINGHLPNVPSAETIEKKGIDVAEINAALLEKIEEMSLYLIQMEERIKGLEIENERLMKRKRN